MLISISFKLFVCQIFLLLVIGTLSQRIRFQPQYEGRYQCQRDSTCMAISSCPPARRVRNGPQCYYDGGYYRRSLGGCCRNSAFAPPRPPPPRPPVLLDTSATDFNVIGSGVPSRDPRTRFNQPYPGNNLEQCTRGTRCLAWSRCPPSRRSRISNECYYEGYSRRNPGVCCVDTRRRVLNAETPNQTPSFLVSPTTTLTTTTMAPLPTNPRNGDCGRSLSITGMMIGGSPSSQGVWPWMVAITNLDGIPTCTGALIDRTHVLTAAHCFISNRPEELTRYALRIGNVDQRLGERYTIRNLAIPRSYENRRFYYDVAVITLDRPVDSPDFMPICLPDSTFRNFTNRGVSLAGWGSTRNGGATSDILMQLTGVPVVSNYQCGSIYRSGTIAGFNAQFPRGINTGFICAGFLEDGSGRDSCEGDSGGPMMVSQGGRWYEIGILSFGHMRCGEPGFPAVYTRVSSVMDFILGNL